MQRFVARENIRHFRDRLETEIDPATRSRLHTLLVQEEDKLGFNYEALGEIDNHIALAKEHVKRQQQLVASFERDGSDTNGALVLLNAYSQTLLAFENQRRKISLKIEQTLL